jgi:signal peptidase I
MKTLAKKEIKDVKPEKPGETPSEFIASMANVLVIGLFIITFCLQAFEIPSSSMEKTLLIGDHLFVDRVLEAPATNWIRPIIPYRQIRHGDIIVFMSPAQPGLYLVKRIVGLPGDRLHLDNGVLYRNGQRVDEAYVVRDLPFNGYRDNFPRVAPGLLDQLTVEWQAELGFHLDNGDLVVPRDRYFAMGDNRDHSYDSRYWGFIPQENIVGRPMFIYWSFDTPPDQVDKTSIPERVAFLGHIVRHFFDETRWRRMFRVVH